MATVTTMRASPWARRLERAPLAHEPPIGLCPSKHMAIYSHLSAIPTQAKQKSEASLCDITAWVSLLGAAGEKLLLTKLGAKCRSGHFAEEDGHVMRITCGDGGTFFFFSGTVVCGEYAKGARKDRKGLRISNLPLGIYLPTFNHER